jgi:hypothetical protein
MSKGKQLIIQFSGPIVQNHWNFSSSQVVIDSVTIWNQQNKNMISLTSLIGFALLQPCYSYSILHYFEELLVCSYTIYLDTYVCLWFRRLCLFCSFQNVGHDRALLIRKFIVDKISKKMENRRFCCLKTCSWISTVVLHHIALTYPASYARPRPGAPSSMFAAYTMLNSSRTQ